jgi:hypothetical protein
VLDPPEKNLGDDDYLNRYPNKINLKAERCCRSVAQTVSESASTANTRKGQQRHGVGKIVRMLPGGPKVTIQEQSATLVYISLCIYFL